jgi:hypothetical protein
VIDIIVLPGRARKLAPDGAGTPNHEPFRTAIHSRGRRLAVYRRTRAYSMRLNGLYLNLKGREREGIVEAGAESEALEEELHRGWACGSGLGGDWHYRDSIAMEFIPVPRSTTRPI